MVSPGHALIEKRRQNERDVCWVLCLVSFLRFVEAARGKTEAVLAACLFARGLLSFVWREKN